MRCLTLSESEISTRPHWSSKALVYHVYPLGLCGAPATAAAQAQPESRLNQFYDWIPYWQELGVNTVLFGPIFASGSHGYDTTDLFAIDPRLGSTEEFASLAKALHQAGLRLVLDGVFNHVGRDFFAFRELQNNPHSAYRHWFHIHEGRSAHGDPFAYDCWEGHDQLVRLNLQHPAVQEYLLGAVSHWIADYGIDGLRLDVAYCLDRDFLHRLAAHCRSLKPDFWLMGEIIHGDYRPLLAPLDAVTNYECYKGLWSSHKDRNCFEIAHSLQRLFGPGGSCQGRTLYNFADNHDVDRVASQLDEPDHLFSLYLMLMTMPGTPSLYYGSEWGLNARKNRGDDRPLRPALSLTQMVQQARQSELWNWIQRLARIRHQLTALQQGDYQELAIHPEQLAFARQREGAICLVAANLSPQPARIRLDRLPGAQGQAWRDLLDPGFGCQLRAGDELEVPARGGRILVPLANF